MVSECTSTSCDGAARTTVRRQADRASNERTDLDAILDAAVVCHLGFVDASAGPVVIPTIHARAGDQLLIHGSAASRMARMLARGVDACVTVTLVDGIVLAKSWMHHSMNYRSAVVFGRAEALTDPEAKLAALRAIVEHVQAGRADESRPPNAKELAATLVLAMPLTEWSVKARSGPPIDDPADADLTWFSGVVPLPSYRLGCPSTAA